MRTFIILLLLMHITGITTAQSDKTNFPDPEFNNEISLLWKDSIIVTKRLEKGSSKMEAKTKMGGFGGSENGYALEGSRSTVRLPSGAELKFVFSTGASVGNTSVLQDSIMRANGMDPAMMKTSMSDFMDPTKMISLYKAEISKGERKIIMQKTPGAMPFGSKKIKSADKYTLSVRKVREGYWLLVVDKILPKGEYAFAMMDITSQDGSSILFAFAID